MTKLRIAAILIVLVMMEAVNSCGSNDTTGQGTSATTTAASASRNDADVTFVQAMIPHHQQALEMSDTLLAKEGIDPRVTALAQQIKTAQGPELQTMQTWSAQWGLPTAPDPAMSDMPGPGMMSGDDMIALQNAEGPEANTLFLELMIQHHEGAIAMAQNEIDGGQFAPAVELARSIVAVQQRELASMRQILPTV